MVEALVDSFFLPDEESSSPRIDKKRRHQATEQKGRQKINLQILDLKNLLPECRSVPTTKASVLECATSSLRRLQSLSVTLTNQNKSLLRENKKLHAELNRLREAGVFVQVITSDDDEPAIKSTELFSPEYSLSPEQLFLGSSPSNSMVFPPTKNISAPNVMQDVRLPDLSVEPQPLSCHEDDPFLTDYLTNLFQSSEEGTPTTDSDFSSPDGSSPLYSPSSSFKFTPFGPLDIPLSDDSPPDSSFTRFTKRRLLFVFLFMIPLFMSLDSLIPSNERFESNDIGAVRVPLEHDASYETTGISIQHYWDILRLVWFVVGGITGLGWVIGAFVWVNGLSEKYTYEESQKEQKIQKTKSQGLRRKAMRNTMKVKLQG
ncbi:hypothetical protein PROFUN_03725 [Planoprotostelium fungivorum]|uniref:BHLH domain-containing protein n=1 Tax=Planoprotostelium fungivorum TaxID=1890364 RepID=A0A2P6NDM9_9EUKA|nr:hypothetical protein PROFUN_03725 [Planoprotostelium fungivorum]